MAESTVTFQTACMCMKLLMVSSRPFSSCHYESEFLLPLLQVFEIPKIKFNLSPDACTSKIVSTLQRIKQHNHS